MADFKGVIIHNLKIFRLSSENSSIKGNLKGGLKQENELLRRKKSERRAESKKKILTKNVWP